MATNWTCPYCDHKVILQKDDISRHEWHWPFDEDRTADGITGQSAVAYACPNEECKQVTLSTHWWSLDSFKSSDWNLRKLIRSWELRPESMARVLPDYIPVQIVEDYNEACRIAKLSPKASATLSRRCLQGIIRDFWGISDKTSLYHEIEAIRDDVDTATWEAIDALRRVGNIGAHMKQDVNLIVTVNPDEAGLLIQLIETLFEDWYISRYERAQRMEALANLGADKSNKSSAPVSNVDEQNSGSDSIPPISDE